MRIETVLYPALGALAAALTAFAAAADPSPTPAKGPKATLTHEALWMMKRVGEPHVSPDGRFAVVSVLEPSYEPDKAVSDLWIVPTDGSAPPRRITSTKAAENDPAWSPDSGSLAFSTKREGDEAEEIYVLDLAQGGEARRVTTVSTGAFAPKWRPDGKAILFESDVYPGALDDAANRKIATDRKAVKANVRVYEHFPVRFWNAWLDDRRPTIMVQALEPGAKAVDILAKTALAHASGFAGAEGETHASLSPVWTPDGREVVFTATTERWNAAFSEVGYQLYRVAADGAGEPTPITIKAGDYRQVGFSAKGDFIYYEYAPQDQEVYHLPRLMRAPWPSGGEPHAVMEGFDREAAAYALTPDGRFVYFLAPDAGREDLYRVPASGGTPALVIAPSSGGYTALQIPQKRERPLLIGSWGSSVSPAEVVRIDPERGAHVNLTRFNVAAAAAIDWKPPEHFYFTSAKGRRIHNMIVLPPHFDPAKSYPLLVLIHGGAASNNPDQISLRWNYHLLAAPGYVILMTDYTGSTSFGEAFAQAIKLDPLKTPGEEINQAVDEALKRYRFIDGSRMCAAGASYGGHLAYWLEATTTRYRCIISHAGEVDLTTQWGTSDGIYGREVTNGGPPWGGSSIWRDQSPITYAAHWKTPILLSIGERDFRVPIGNTLEAWSVLQRQKVPSRLLVWPDAWHWILKPEDSRRFYQEVDTWLAEHLGPDADHAPKG